MGMVPSDKKMSALKSSSSNVPKLYITQSPVTLLLSERV